MGLRKLLRGRLALRIYLVGLAQFIVIALGLSFIVEMSLERNLRTSPQAAEVRFVAKMAEGAVNDPPRLWKVIENAQNELHATVTIYDPAGTIVATNAPAPMPRCVHGPPGPRPFPGRSMEMCFVESLLFPDGRLGQLEYRNSYPPPPFKGTWIITMVLVVVGISSWLLARSLTRPLGKLSMAARALGRGDLKARVGLKNGDELGDVSRAFDEMAERVAALLRAERELLANVSHELRTPLSRIRMALALVADAEGDAAVAREMLGEIGSDLDELERLISDVLTAARLDFDDAGSPSGIPPLRRENVDMADLLERAATRFRFAHSTRTLKVQIPEDLPEIQADPVLLRRVFDNLLENAHKYTERSDEPIALVARFGDEITIDIIDKGIGIGEEDLGRVFRPFYRVDKSRTRATGGLGLGLPLAKRIVEAHGGTLELTSVLRKGTRVRVRLPITAH